MSNKLDFVASWPLILSLIQTKSRHHCDDDAHQLFNIPIKMMLENFINKLFIHCTVTFINENTFRLVDNRSQEGWSASQRIVKLNDLVSRLSKIKGKKLDQFCVWHLAKGWWTCCYHWFNWRFHRIWIDFLKWIMPKKYEFNHMKTLIRYLKMFNKMNQIEWKSLWALPKPWKPKIQQNVLFISYQCQRKILWYDVLQMLFKPRW